MFQKCHKTLAAVIKLAESGSSQRLQRPEPIRLQKIQFCAAYGIMCAHHWQPWAGSHIGVSQAGYIRDRTRRTTSQAGAHHRQYAHVGVMDEGSRKQGQASTQAESERRRCSRLVGVCQIVQIDTCRRHSNVLAFPETLCSSGSKTKHAMHAGTVCAATWWRQNNSHAFRVM